MYRPLLRPYQMQGVLIITLAWFRTKLYGIRRGILGSQSISWSDMHNLSRLDRLISCLNGLRLLIIESLTSLVFNSLTIFGWWLDNHGLKYTLGLIDRINLKCTSITSRASLVRWRITDIQFILPWFPWLWLLLKDIIFLFILDWIIFRTYLTLFSIHSVFWFDNYFFLIAITSNFIFFFLSWFWIVKGLAFWFALHQAL